MAKRKFLYSSTSKPGLGYLQAAPLPESEGFKKGERGVWATEDLILSRAFGIDRKEFGTFYLDPCSRTLELVDWKFNQIPRGFIAYTYYVEPKGFKRVRARDWKFVCHRRVKISNVKAYDLRDFLLKHFEVWELQRTRVCS